MNEETRPKKRIQPWEWVVCLLIVVVLGAILYPVQTGRGPAQRTACISNLKQVSLGISLYSTDNDDRLPLADNWIDSGAPYTKVKEIYTCPELFKEKKEYGYAMNRYLNGATLKSIAEPAEAYLIYETSVLTRNANEYLPTFPIPGRHNGMNAVAYVDSHVKNVKMSSSK